MNSSLDAYICIAIIFSPLIVTNNIVINLFPFDPQPQVFQHICSFCLFPISCFQPISRVIGVFIGTFDHVKININLHMHSSKSNFYHCALAISNM